MSSYNLVVLTEGLTDRAFYDYVVTRAVASMPSVSPAIRTCRDLDCSTGGKNALLAFHGFLKSDGSLFSSLDGKKTVFVVCLDKDVDDLRRSKIRCPNLVYTEFFDIESHLFRCGNFVPALCAATMLDRTSVEATLSPVDTWLDRASESWKDWVLCCLFATLYGCGDAPNYGASTSPIHDTARECLVDKLNVFKNNARNCINMKEDIFVKKWARVEKLVGKYYRSGLRDRIFKGKWYAKLMSDELKSKLNGRDANFQKLEKRIVEHLIPLANYDDARICNLANRIGQLAQIVSS